MGVVLIIILVILGISFSRMLKVDPKPADQEPIDFDQEGDGWSALEEITKHLKNEDGRELVNSERGENAPPVFSGQNRQINGMEERNTLNDSSERVLTDFTPESYVFGENSFLREEISENNNNDLEIAERISRDRNSRSYGKQSVLSDQMSLMLNDSKSGFGGEIGGKNNLKAGNQLNGSSGNRLSDFNFRDAIVYTSILNPKFKEYDSSNREILI